MIYLKYLKHFADFIKYQRSPTFINSTFSSIRRNYNTHKVGTAVHNFNKLPQGRVSNVKKNLDGGAWFLLVVPITAFGLGCWQVKRKKWKEDLIEALTSKTKLPPVPLPTEWDEIADMEFRKVEISGEFDHSGEMYLGPRSLLIDGESNYEGKLLSTVANGSCGYYVVTPFIRSDTKERILVNRGWIPYPNKNPKTREEGQIKGEVELTGVIRNTSEKPAPFSPSNKEDVRVWFIRDIEKMAEMVGGVPVYLDAVAETTVPGGPIGGQTRANLRNEHLSYIITWFSLSAATSVMWYSKYIKRIVIL